MYAVTGERGLEGGALRGHLPRDVAVVEQDRLTGRDQACQLDWMVRRSRSRRAVDPTSVLSGGTLSGNAVLMTQGTWYCG
jgi:hypothetical protein